MKTNKKKEWEEDKEAIWADGYQAQKINTFYILERPLSKCISCVTLFLPKNFTFTKLSHSQLRIVFYLFRLNQTRKNITREFC